MGLREDHDMDCRGTEPRQGW